MLANDTQCKLALIHPNKQHIFMAVKAALRFQHWLIWLNPWLLVISVSVKIMRFCRHIFNEQSQL